MNTVQRIQGRPVQENVVPAYPYDDALFSLFHSSLVGADGWFKSNPRRRYSPNLFHNSAKELHGRAAAVACLFENIILSYRSLELPDIDTYTKSGDYAHPDLRLQMPYDTPPQLEKFRAWMEYDGDALEYTEWDYLESVAISMRRRRPFRAFFSRHKALFPDISYIDFTINTIMETHLAHKHNAVLLGNDVFTEFYRLLRTEIPADMELFPPVEGGAMKTQQLNLTDAEALSLNFAPATIDGFAAVRMDKGIREYGKNWRQIICNSAPTELRENLLNEMAKANQYASIAKKASGVFSFVGTFLTWVGSLIPGADVAGIAVDVLDKGTGKVEKRLSWSLVGAKMHEVAQKANLANYLLQKREEAKV